MDFWEELKSGKFAQMVKETSRGCEILSSSMAFNVIKPLTAAHNDVEVMYGIFLDTKNHVLGIEQLASGTISSAVVYPREIVKAALERKASCLILAHNHPTGDPKPSEQDDALTRKIYAALSVVDVKLLDHIVVGDSYYSYADEGKLIKMKTEYESFFGALFQGQNGGK